MLVIMLVSASWIAVQPLAEHDCQVLFAAFIAIAVGGVSTLVLVTQGVLEVQPWFAPRYVLPLGGMIFASAMNAVSLAAERLESERGKGLGIMESRRVAFQASMIPMINSFLAVGLVTLPGMMTGQVLSGVSPLVAAQYQIVVMSMLFGASGVASAIYLTMRARQLTPTTTAL
jgi:putative ABC transport system permease protein